MGRTHALSFPHVCALITAMRACRLAHNVHNERNAIDILTVRTERDNTKEHVSNNAVLTMHSAMRTCRIQHIGVALCNSPLVVRSRRHPQPHIAVSNAWMPPLCKTVVRARQGPHGFKGGWLAPEPTIGHNDNAKANIYRQKP